MKNDTDSPGFIESTAAIIVFACIFGSMWLLVFCAARQMIRAFAH